MTFMRWDDSFSVGIEVIDNQHKRIVEYINDLDDAVHTKDQAKVKRVLEDMVNYTLTHFSFEENLMRKGNYEFYEAHKKVHTSFADQIRQYQQRFARGEDISRLLLSDLRIWLTNHIKRDDKDYAPAVKQTTEQDSGWLSKTLKKFFG